MGGIRARAPVKGHDDGESSDQLRHESELYEIALISGGQELIAFAILVGL